MIAKDLIAALRKCKGPVYGLVNSAGDCRYFQLVKADVIAQFVNGNMDAETGFKVTTDNAGRNWFDADYPDGLDNGD